MLREANEERPAPACGSAATERHSFEEDCNERLARTGEGPVAVLLVDMQDIGSLDDGQDPQISARVLELVAQRIQCALRGSDHVYRLDGNKSAILLDPVVSEAEVRTVADRICGLLRQPYMVQGRMLSAPVSIGGALASPDVGDAQLLLRRAGTALRRARSSTSASVQLFDLATEERAARRHALSLDLRKALLLRQLEVYYQPQVDIESRALIGFEALLRWRHPQLGWVSPIDFIPIAEETGSIGAIGDWVLKTACKQAARLPENVTIAVNVSPLQFRTEAFFVAVQAALASSSISPARLEIEITEGVLLQNADSVESTLHHLRLEGVRIAMDDFGTGYSSLGQLVRLPFDTIKIDRSLVGGSTKERAVVRAIAMLGKGLGLSVLAEGVETAEQLANVRADGCVSVQGYFFGRPTPASELNSVIARLTQPLHHPNELHELTHER